jgi:hypothetical protein
MLKLIAVPSKYASAKQVGFHGTMKLNTTSSGVNTRFQAEPITASDVNRDEVQPSWVQPLERGA